MIPTVRITRDGSTLIPNRMDRTHASCTVRSCKVRHNHTKYGTLPKKFSDGDSRVREWHPAEIAGFLQNPAEIADKPQVICGTDICPVMPEMKPQNETCNIVAERMAHQLQNVARSLWPSTLTSAQHRAVDLQESDSEQAIQSVASDRMAHQLQYVARPFWPATIEAAQAHAIELIEAE